MFKRSMLAGMAIAFLSSLGGANAQSTSDVPASRTATYGDWTVRCRMLNFKAADGKNTEKETCELVNVIRVKVPETKNTKGETIPEYTSVLAQVLIGRQVATGDLKVLVQVPAGVWLRRAVAIVVGEAEDKLESAAAENQLTASYFNCQNSGCLADATLTDDWKKNLLEAKVAQMSFVDNTQRLFKVAVSLKGLPAAMTAIAE